ncbi:MAG: CDP-alcohol phosphatidyltransferase family protein [Clostridia bacterium]|nr:CDP-alcohol phosphatidyltransferase family protein [Clostridia bacterium]
MRKLLRDLTKDIWNLPNALTMLRLVLIPVFLVCYLTGHPYWALGVFCAASITDFFDGFLARRLNKITAFGKLFDPLADKLMVVCALMCHVISGRFCWVALAIVATKEMIMIVGSTYMLSQDHVVSANLYGKAATVLFITSVILGFFHFDLPFWGPIRPDEWILWLSVTAALLALTVYVRDSLKVLRADGANANPENKEG